MPITYQVDSSTRRQLIAFDPSSGSLRYPLPKASDFKGWTMILKHDSASINTVTIFPTGSDTLDGQAQAILSDPRAAKIYVSNGVNRWMLISEYAGV